MRALAQARIHRQHMRAGVTIVDPASTLVDVTVAIGADTVIEPSSFLRGATTIGERCAVGPLTTLIDTALGDEVRVPHSYLVECEVRTGASVGPFAYLRPGALLRERAKAGTFVEIKNSDIGEGTQDPAPELHRRRRRRRPTRTSAPRPSPPTTTAAASTARRSARTSARRSTRPSSRR